MGSKVPGSPRLSHMVRGAVKDAREALSEAVGEDHVQAAGDAARKGVKAAGRAYGKAEDTVSQANAWTEVRSTLDDLIEVVRTQHAMILQLLDRVSALEGTGPNVGSSAKQPVHDSLIAPLEQ